MVRVLLLFYPPQHTKRFGPINFLADGVNIGVFDFPGQFQTTHLLTLPVPLALLADGALTLQFTGGQDGDGGIIDFTSLRIETQTAIPEPATIGAVALGLAALVRRRLRRR